MPAWLREKPKRASDGTELAGRGGTPQLNPPPENTSTSSGRWVEPRIRSVCVPSDRYDVGRDAVCFCRRTARRR
ncbi:hypothetical protein BHK98_03230 [Hornefia porci]|uniref:Uncharacterized protein n=1 Tax=Hornefia porci TaxID=2652292 RepID=A0A1Q9JFZ8_9FIRM|nr:hypothetical protein BHK98_03230 [Hornefia porci]